eukprot:519455-Hanusia_phi.AAC.3
MCELVNRKVRWGTVPEHGWAPSTVDSDVRVQKTTKKQKPRSRAESPQESMFAAFHTSDEVQKGERSCHKGEAWLIWHSDAHETKGRVNPEIKKLKKFKEGNVLFVQFIFCLIRVKVVFSSDFDKRMLDLRKKLAVQAEKEREKLERESKCERASSDPYIVADSLQPATQAQRASKGALPPRLLRYLPPAPHPWAHHEQVKNVSPRRPSNGLEVLLDNELRRAEV